MNRRRWLRVLLPAALWVVSSVALPLHSVLEAHEHLSCEGAQGHFHVPCPLDPDEACPACEALSVATWQAADAPKSPSPEFAFLPACVPPAPDLRAGEPLAEFPRGPPTA